MKVKLANAWIGEVASLLLNRLKTCVSNAFGIFALISNAFPVLPNLDDISNLHRPSAAIASSARSLISFFLKLFDSLAQLKQTLDSIPRGNKPATDRLDQRHRNLRIRLWWSGSGLALTGSGPLSFLSRSSQPNRQTKGDCMGAIKVCSCGKTYKRIPAGAKVNELGTWITCDRCKSTMLISKGKVAA